MRLVDRGAPGDGATRAAGGILSPTDPAEWAPPLGPFNLDAIAPLAGLGRRRWRPRPGTTAGATCWASCASRARTRAWSGTFLAASAAGAAAGGWAHRTLDADELARLEPGLAPVHEALHVPGTAAVRVDALVAALVAACAGSASSSCAAT